MTDPIRVMIVDDNEDALAYLERVMAFEDNIEVVGRAGDGNEAVDLMMSQTPHIVLMDLNMPQMDGITACGLIKRLAPATQVILISVQDDGPSRRHALENGAAAFLIKPVDPEDLLELVHKAYAIYQRSAPSAPGSQEIGTTEQPK